MSIIVEPEHYGTFYFINSPDNYFTFNNNIYLYDYFSLDNDYYVEFNGNYKMLLHKNELVPVYNAKCTHILIHQFRKDAKITLYFHDDNNLLETERFKIIHEVIYEKQ